MTLSPTALDRVHDKFMAIISYTEVIKKLIDRGFLQKSKSYIDIQAKACEQGMAILDDLRAYKKEE